MRAENKWIDQQNKEMIFQKEKIYKVLSRLRNREAKKIKLEIKEETLKLKLQKYIRL